MSRHHCFSKSGFRLREARFKVLNEVDNNFTEGNREIFNYKYPDGSWDLDQRSLAIGPHGNASQ